MTRWLTLLFLPLLFISSCEEKPNHTALGNPKAGFITPTEEEIDQQVESYFALQRQLEALVANYEENAATTREMEELAHKAQVWAEKIEDWTDNALNSVNEQILLQSQEKIPSIQMVNKLQRIYQEDQDFARAYEKFVSSFNGE
jgi:beta-glucosidase-like glycosyl hydrolase